MGVSVGLVGIWLIFHAVSYAMGMTTMPTAVTANSSSSRSDKPRTPSSPSTPPSNISAAFLTDYLYDCGDECWKKYPSLLNRTIFQPKFSKSRSQNTTLSSHNSSVKATTRSASTTKSVTAKLADDDPFPSGVLRPVPRYPSSLSGPSTTSSFFRKTSDLLSKTSMTFSRTTNVPNTIKPVLRNANATLVNVSATTHRRTTLSTTDIHEPLLEQWETINETAFYLMTFNGSCHEIEQSQDAAEGFVESFSQAFMSAFDNLDRENLRVWSIACGSVIVNFSMPNWEHANHFGYIHQRIFGRGNFSLRFTGKLYTPVALTRLHGDEEQTLAHLQIPPSSGRFYPGVIYVVVGALVGLALLTIATILIVRLHRRRGREFSLSITNDTVASAPSKQLTNLNAQDYTLTRLPRTTKLFMSDMERNPWAYTNPDFQASLPSLHAPGRKTEYLNFVNHGVIPTRQRVSSPDSTSSMTKNPLLEVRAWGQKDTSVSTATSTAAASSSQSSKEERKSERRNELP